MTSQSRWASAPPTAAALPKLPSSSSSPSFRLPSRPSGSPHLPPAKDSTDQPYPLSSSSPKVSGTGSGAPRWTRPSDPFLAQPNLKSSAPSPASPLATSRRLNTYQSHDSLAEEYTRPSSLRPKETSHHQATLASIESKGVTSGPAGTSTVSTVASVSHFPDSIHPLDRHVSPSSDQDPSNKGNAHHRALTEPLPARVVVPSVRSDTPSCPPPSTPPSGLAPLLPRSSPSSASIKATNFDYSGPHVLNQTSPAKSQTDWADAESDGSLPDLDDWGIDLEPSESEAQGDKAVRSGKPSTNEPSQDSLKNNEIETGRRMHSQTPHKTQNGPDIDILNPSFNLLSVSSPSSPRTGGGSSPGDPVRRKGRGFTDSERTGIGMASDRFTGW